MHRSEFFGLVHYWRDQGKRGEVLVKFAPCLGQELWPDCSLDVPLHVACFVSLAGVLVPDVEAVVVEPGLDLVQVGFESLQIGDLPGRCGE